MQRRQRKTHESHELASRITFDHRNSLSKLPAIINYLRDLGYSEDDEIPYDDVEFAIENVRGVDRRTVRKYIVLLVKFGYLEPLKGTKRVWSKKFVQVRTKFSVSSREYSIVKGFKFYRFGPRAPKIYQESLIPPRSPLPRSDEGVGSKNVCVT